MKKLGWRGIVAVALGSALSLAMAGAQSEAQKHSTTTSSQEYEKEGVDYEATRQSFRQAEFAQAMGHPGRITRQAATRPSQGRSKRDRKRQRAVQGVTDMAPRELIICRSRRRRAGG